MRHGSLFSGIGGFDLAAEWMGWENVFHCEINEFCQKVLKHYWPHAKSYNDIKKTDFTIHRGTIDILTGGFPCQPYSTAGLRKGKEDERHLWPQMLRAVREIQPRWIVGENVRGLTNWNGGMVFDEVQADLETEGYEIIPFLLPACAVNAPHRRDRIWFIAHSKIQRERSGKQSEFNAGRVERLEGAESWRNSDNNDEAGDATNASGIRKREQANQIIAITNGWKTRIEFSGIDWGRISPHTGSAGREELNIPDLAERSEYGTGFPNNKPTGWQNFPTQSPVCNGDDELSTRLDGITFSKWRNESIKGGGNAVVPALVLQIFKSIQQYENL